MSRQGKKINIKLDLKRLILAAIVLIAIVVVVVLIVKAINKKSDDISLDGSAAGIIEKAEMINKVEAEYDGNPYNVPESFTTSDNTYAGESGEQLTDAQINEAKNVIRNKFLSYSSEELGIVNNMDAVRVIFNSGTTVIADSTCLVFNAYEEVDGALQYICKFAMSLDGSILYKFDADLFVYRMIGQ